MVSAVSTVEDLLMLKLFLLSGECEGGGEGGGEGGEGDTAACSAATRCSSPSSVHRVSQF